MLEARSDEEVKQIGEISREIVDEMLKMHGFIGWTGIVIGHRMMTVTAWETPEDSRQMQSGGSHPEGVRKFLGPELASGGMTSVWSSGRFTAHVSLSSLWPNGFPRENEKHMPMRRGIAGAVTDIGSVTLAASKGAKIYCQAAGTH